MAPCFSKIFTASSNYADWECDQIESESERNICFQQKPFNYFITLHDVYLFPERVKEYAESLQYTNAASIVNYAPVSRTYASISAVVTETLTEIIGNVYGRHFTHYPQDYIAMFSFMSDDAMTFHRHNDGHFDIQDNDEKILNGVLHLE